VENASSTIIKPHACVKRIVQQHGSECAPARIEHRLACRVLCERGGIHVGDKESTVGLDQAVCSIVQEIFSAIRDLRVNRSGFGFDDGRAVRGPGRVPSRGKKRSSSIGGRASSLNAAKVFNPRSMPRLGTERSRIDPTEGLFLSFPRLRARHTDIQIPASAAVFAEICPHAVRSFPDRSCPTATTNVPAK